MGRDAGPHPFGERIAGAIADRGEVLEGPRWIGSKDFEVDGGAQTELRAGHRSRAAVAAVPDRRHPGRKALCCSELGDVDVLVPADPRLALDVQRDPLRKVAEPVAEAGVDRILEVRVRVHETGNDHRIVVPCAFTEVFSRPDRGDAPVVDDDRAGLDRRALDRQHPVGRQDPVHGSVTLAGSGRGARRSISTASQIDPSYNTISGTASSVVVTGSIPGSSTAMTATMK